VGCAKCKPPIGLPETIPSELVNLKIQDVDFTVVLENSTVETLASNL
jgi:hypothetical protein